MLTRFLVNHLIPYISPKLYQISDKTRVQGISLKLVRLPSISHRSTDSGRLFSAGRFLRFRTDLWRTRIVTIYQPWKRSQSISREFGRVGITLKDFWDVIDVWVLEKDHHFRVWKASAVTVGQTVGYIKWALGHSIMIRNSPKNFATSPKYNRLDIQVVWTPNLVQFFFLFPPVISYVEFQSSWPHSSSSWHRSHWTSLCHTNI